MASQVADVPPSAKPSISSPTRRKHRASYSSHSISEATSLPKVHRSHHAHAQLQHVKDRDKHKDKDDKSISLPNTSLLPNVTLTDADTGASRSESATPSHSQAASRRTSLLVMNQDLDGAISTSKAEWKSGKEVELTGGMEKTAVRASELRMALGNLNTLSNDTTRRLDNTYYTVLEKLGVLQSTVASLKELSQQTRHLNDEFGTEADKMEKEIAASLDGFYDFTGQQQKIEELAGRVTAGREKVKTFAARVDVVRDRVEGWEKAEGEWQDRTRKRLRVLWILMSIAATICLALSVFRYTPARTPGQEILSPLNVSGILDSISELEKLRNETWSLKRTAVDALLNMSSCNVEQEVLEEDPRLRLFDEL